MPKPKFLLRSAAALIIAACAILNAAEKAAATGVTYRNDQYDLTFPLTENWRGFSVITQSWQETPSLGKNDVEIPGENGVVLLLRHPKWTAKDPYQDIPILIFTKTQWLAHQGDFAISAGGIEYELMHNDKYVFAIHSRYNADDSAKGWKEAAEIVDRITASNTHPLISR